MDSAKDLHSAHPINRHLQGNPEVLGVEESGRSLALSWSDCLTILHAAARPLTHYIKANIDGIYIV